MCVLGHSAERHVLMARHKRQAVTASRLPWALLASTVELMGSPSATGRATTSERAAGSNAVPDSGLHVKTTLLVLLSSRLMAAQVRSGVPSRCRRRPVGGGPGGNGKTP